MVIVPGAVVIWFIWSGMFMNGLAEKEAKVGWKATVQHEQPAPQPSKQLQFIVE